MRGSCWAISELAHVRLSHLRLSQADPGYLVLTRLIRSHFTCGQLVSEGIVPSDPILGQLVPDRLILGRSILRHLGRGQTDKESGWPGHA